MEDGFRDQILFFEPFAGSFVESGYFIRIRLVELLAQRFCKKLMIAVPLAFMVKMNEKSISLFNLPQEQAAVLATSKYATQRGGQSIEDHSFL